MHAGLLCVRAAVLALVAPADAGDALAPTGECGVLAQLAVSKVAVLLLLLLLLLLLPQR